MFICLQCPKCRSEAKLRLIVVTGVATSFNEGRPGVMRSIPLAKKLTHKTNEQAETGPRRRQI